MGKNAHTSAQTSHDTRLSGLTDICRKRLTVNGKAAISFAAFFVSVEKAGKTSLKNIDTTQPDTVRNLT